MRIMFRKDNVEEFVSINAVPCWAYGKDVEKYGPDMYSVSMGITTPNEIKYDYVGEYALDGKKETYDAAVNNFEKICEQLLINGWVKAEEFENFVWY